jgi:IS5 family transposase
MEEMLIDTPCFRRFAGIDMIEGRIPDETTILNFRHLLEEHQIAEQIFESVNQSLSEKGVMLKAGTILDATIINAPSSTKNNKRERDPEMHSVAKCQPTSKTAPLPTPKSEPPPTRSVASFPEWFRLGCAGGASACSWFS